MAVGVKNFKPVYTKIPPAHYAALTERTQAEFMTSAQWLRKLIARELGLAPPDNGYTTYRRRRPRARS